MNAPAPGGADRPDAARPILRVDLEGLSFDANAVLGRLRLEIGAGETVALVGPSGIGKSSLLRAIAGLETGYRGTISAPERIGIIFQEPTLLPWRSLTDNLRVTTGLDATAIEDALVAVGLGGRGAAFPNQLSLGQQRRLSLARAFAIRPDLLLMDEPFVSLDPGLVDEMMVLFDDLRRATGTTTLFVTHVEAEARRLAGRIVILGGHPAVVTADHPNH